MYKYIYFLYDIKALIIYFYMIPKKIFQTWKYKELPFPIAQSIQNMIAYNPEYEYKLFDDNDMLEYIKTHFDEDIQRAYLKLNVGAAKADFWRYLILYREGGIYLDIDSVLYSPLNTLIKETDKAIISREKNPDIFLQWCMIFEQNHPILKRTIDKCVYNILNETTTDIMYLTGPRVFSQAIQEYIGFNAYNQPDEIVNKKVKDVRFFDYDFPGYCNWKHDRADVLYYNVLHWSKDPIRFL